MRSVCLAAITARSVAEDLIAEGTRSPGFEAYLSTAPLGAPSVIANWIEREQIASYLTPHEQVCMAKPAGHWRRQEILNGYWRREALMTLEWALGIVRPLPAADTRLPMEDVLEGAWLLKDISEFHQRASLLPAEEIWKSGT
jgi:hypothetical protein